MTKRVRNISRVDPSFLLPILIRFFAITLKLANVYP